VDVVLVRDPHGETTYSHIWNHADPKWDDELVKQVPFGLDPRKSHNDGIFVMPMTGFGEINCMSTLSIAHAQD
jgi:hypothetical protein